jgi:hypothetical protein
MHGKHNTVRVWDPLVRVFHWTLAAAFLTACLVEDDWLGLHVLAGNLEPSERGAQTLQGVRASLRVSVRRPDHKACPERRARCSPSHSATTRAIA